MNPKWFGDSYDIVKRFFISILKDSGYSVYVDPMFTGDSTPIEDDFFDFIGAGLPPEIDLLPSKSALFIDPDTGIGKKKTKRHITISGFAERLDMYSIVFAYDQSFSRGSNHEEQISIKLKELKDLDARGFYYNSHAKFLFGSKSSIELDALKEGMAKTGLPFFRIIDQS